MTPTRWPIHLYHSLLLHIWKTGLFVGGLSILAIVLVSCQTVTTGAGSLPAGIQVDTVASDLGFVTDIAIGPDGLLYYTDTERKQIGVLDANGTLVERIPIPGPPETIGTVLGFALDPNHSTNSIIYLHYLITIPCTNRLIRMKHEQGVVSDVAILFDELLPPAPPGFAETCTPHNGGHLVFGPDGDLYLSMGDNQHGKLAQDLTKPQGKLLRIHPTDGSAYENNPFYDDAGPNDDRIWALGFRNPFAFAFDPIAGELWLSENGPDCGDEINRVQKGGNYGWPESKLSPSECIPLPWPYIEPAWYWEKTIGPTGLDFYLGAAIPTWAGSLLLCDVNNGRLHRLRLNKERSEIIDEETIDLSPAACSIDVVAGPDGTLYLAATTAIFRLRPAILDS